MRDVLLAVGLAAALGVGVYATDAYPHSAPSGWEYSRDCCSTRDCAQIANVTVRITAEGYEVTLKPGDHMMIAFPRVYLIPFNDRKIRKSGDEFFHACIGSPTPPVSTVEPQRMICLYVPLMAG